MLYVAGKMWIPVIARNLGKNPEYQEITVIVKYPFLIDLTKRD